MIKILIHTDTRYPVNRKVIRKAIEDTLMKYKIANLDAEVSVAVIGKRKMKEIGEKYLNDSRAHDVLSFPLEEVSKGINPNNMSRQGFINSPDDILRLGDIILCWPKVLETASSDDVMVDDEVYFLTSHATEHLLGKHHE